MGKISAGFHKRLREERIREAQTHGVALEIAARVAAGEPVSPGERIPWAARDASGEVSVTEEMIAAAVEYYREAREAVRSEMDVRRMADRAGGTQKGDRLAGSGIWAGGVFGLAVRISDSHCCGEIG